MRKIWLHLSYGVIIIEFVGGFAKFKGYTLDLPEGIKYE